MFFGCLRPERSWLIVFGKPITMSTESGNQREQLPAEADPGALRERLDRLARRYYAPLTSFFRKRTRNAQEVQDLVQQVFLRLAQHGEIAAVRNAEGYLFQTASNTLKDHVRNASVRDRFMAERRAQISDENGSDFSIERILLAQEGTELLTQALRELPERTRDILMLRCFEGLKYGEIARLQGLSVRSIEKHVQRALARG
jgi:RNA polymerase sigma factor (sigma-70 family)